MTAFPLKALPLRAAVGVCVALLVAAGAYVANKAGGTAPDKIAVQRAEQVAASAAEDLQGTLSTLPPWITVTHRDLSDGGWLLQFTATSLDATVCVTVDAAVGPAWLLDGDQNAVSVHTPSTPGPCAPVSSAD